jgi:hypothetical protein
VLSGKRCMIACGRKLLKNSLELANGSRRAQDVGGNSPDVSGDVAIWLVP